MLKKILLILTVIASFNNTSYCMEIKNKPKKITRINESINTIIELNQEEDTNSDQDSITEDIFTENTSTDEDTDTDSKDTKENCTIIMPERDKLEDLFSEHCLGYFAEETGIIDTLFPGQEIDPLILQFAEKAAMLQFTGHMKKETFFKTFVIETKKNLKKLMAKLAKINKLKN